MGPAVAFLYSGPAINVLAIILTARILGFQIGAARAVGAVAFSIVIGLLMHLFFRKEEQDRAESQDAMPQDGASRPLWQTAAYFGVMAAILVFANWSKPEIEGGVWGAVYRIKWVLTGICGAALGGMLSAWFRAAWWKVAGVAGATTVVAVLFPAQPVVPVAAAVLGLAGFGGYLALRGAPAPYLALWAVNLSVVTFRHLSSLREGLRPRFGGTGKGRTA